MTVCLPGAKVEDVDTLYEKIIVGTPVDTIVTLNVGVNNIGNTKSEEVIRRYRNLLDKIRYEGRRCIIVGIAPKLNAGSEWISRAIGINSRLEKFVDKGWVEYIDSWDHFWGNSKLYSADGLHFSRLGTDTLKVQIENALVLLDSNRNFPYINSKGNQ